MKVRTRPGQGTTFTLIFPASTKSASAVARDAAPKVGHATGTVLVAEDDDAIRRMTVLMLESIGLTVVSASDGAEALHLFEERTEEFAFVLLDFMMPGMSGEEVIDGTRTHRHGHPDRSDEWVRLGGTQPALRGARRRGVPAEAVPAATAASDRARATHGPGARIEL